ncbi:MAG: NERD domain-containing protein [Ruminococcaceae bacterium]|nr:NERD domain-containing protein [Oscillospiraceae bacterium]
MEVSMSNPIKTLIRRSHGAQLPPIEEIERFGADGEEAVCRLLRRHFGSVIRNVVVPHKKLYLEKDLMVVCDDVPFVIEIKNWKGEIGCRGDVFYQNKDNGVHKELKSPVGTTNQFIRRMKEFYDIARPIWGIVVFAEPDCRLDLPEELDGVALLPLNRLVPFIRARAKADNDQGFLAFDSDRILRCTRFYSEDSEFCKGILADNHLLCTAEDGTRVRLDTTRLRFITVENQPLRLRDKLYVTYANGGCGVFYNRDAELTVGCLDGTWRKIALHRVRHIVF